MSFGNYWENAILNHIFGKAEYTPPEHIYVALSLTNPGEDGSGISEPAHESYERVETSPGDWTEAADGQISNAEVITFPLPTGNWGTIYYGAFFDAAEGGNFLAANALMSPMEVLGGGAPPTFEIGAITISLD